jgi:hypothetical protein
MVRNREPIRIEKFKYLHDTIPSLGFWCRMGEWDQLGAIELN